MTRAYLRLDPAYDERKADYPDGPYAALISCICLGESQTERGRFRSVRYLRALLGRRGRFVPYLVAHRDLAELPDGRLYLVGWDEWQEGDWKVQERLERVRQRRSDIGIRRDGSAPYATPPNVAHATSDATDDRLDVAVGGELSEAVGGDGEPCETGPEVYYEVTLRYPQRDSTLHDWVVRLGETFGVPSLRRAMAREYAQNRSLKTLLSRTEAVLTREIDRAEAEEERRRISEQHAPIRPLQVVAPEPDLSEEEIQERIRRYREAK